MIESKNYAWPVTSINREDWVSFENWYNNNFDIINENTIIIWGAGIRGTEFSVFFQKRQYDSILFTDSNSEKWGGNINGYKIISPYEVDVLMKTNKYKILISTENSDEIEKELYHKGYKREADFFTVKTDLYQKYMDEFKRIYTNEILIMGDCEFTTISMHDQDTNNLAEMLKAELGKEKCKVLAMHGMGLRSHYNIFRAQINEKMIPQILVLMINFDTLTGKQHLLPRSQHEELLRSIFSSIDCQEQEFGEYLDEVHRRSQNIQIEFYTEEKIESNAKLHDIKSKNYFKLNYLYQLDEKTEGVIYLIKILDLANQFGVNVIPFIPPINYEYGRKLFDNSFEEKYINNVTKIKRIVEERGFCLLDFSFLLPPEMFAEKNTPDETTNEKGRKIITEQIMHAIISRR